MVNLTFFEKFLESSLKEVLAAVGNEFVRRTKRTNNVFVNELPNSGSREIVNWDRNGPASTIFDERMAAMAKSEASVSKMNGLELSG